MFKKLLLALAAMLLLASAAHSQAVGTYKAKKSEAVVKTVKKVKPHNAPFIGFNVGVTGTTGTIKALDFNIGTDIAFSTKKTFAFGFFAGYETIKKANVGLLFVHGNYAEGSAFFWGIGFSRIFTYTKTLEYEGLNFDREYRGYRFLLRCGFQPKSNLYYGLTLSYGSLRRDDNYGYYGKDSIMGACLTIGYRLNTKLKD